MHKFIALTFSFIVSAVAVLSIIFLLIPNLSHAKNEAAIVKFKASDGTSRTSFLFTSNCQYSLEGLLIRTKLFASSITISKCISESEMVNLMEDTPFVYVPSEKQGDLLHGASLNACKGFEKIYHNMGYYDAFCSLVRKRWLLK